MYDKGADRTVTWCLTESEECNGQKRFAKARGGVEAFFAQAKNKFPAFHKAASAKNSGRSTVEAGPPPHPPELSPRI